MEAVLMSSIKQFTVDLCCMNTSLITEVFVVLLPLWESDLLLICWNKEELILKHSKALHSGWTSAAADGFHRKGASCHGTAPECRRCKKKATIPADPLWMAFRNPFKFPFQCNHSRLPAVTAERQMSRAHSVGDISAGVHVFDLIYPEKRLRFKVQTRVLIIVSHFAVTSVQTRQFGRQRAGCLTSRPCNRLWFMKRQLQRHVGGYIGNMYQILFIVI